MVAIHPLILLRGTPEEVNGRIYKVAGGLCFLKVEVVNMSYCLILYVLSFWVLKKWMHSIPKSLKFLIV